MNKTTKSFGFGRLALYASAGAAIVLPLLSSSSQAAASSEASAGVRYANSRYADSNNRGRGRGRGNNRNDDWRDRNRHDNRRDRDRDGGWRGRDRDRDGDWRDRDGDWRNRGDRGRDDNWNNGGYVGERGSMTATVIRDSGNGRFDVRADDNRIFNVRTNSSQARRVDAGDRVELVGYLTGSNTFVADSVRVIGNYGGGYGSGVYNGGYGNNDIDFYATVISTFNRSHLQVRADDGQTFSVSTRNSISSNIDRGDRVRVTGLSTNRNVVSNATVVLVGNSGYGGGVYGQTVSFYGRVENGNNRGGVITVRGDNGRTYTVRPNNDSTFRRGERVHIVGTYNGGTVRASSITRY